MFTLHVHEPACVIFALLDFIVFWLILALVSGSPCIDWSSCHVSHTCHNVEIFTPEIGYEYR